MNFMKNLVEISKTYKNGVLNGESKFYYRNGNLKKTEYYENGIKVSEVINKDKNGNRVKGGLFDEFIYNLKNGL